MIRRTFLNGVTRVTCRRSSAVLLKCTVPTMTRVGRPQHAWITNSSNVLADATTTATTTTTTTAASHVTEINEQAKHDNHDDVVDDDMIVQEVPPGLTKLVAKINRLDFTAAETFYRTMLPINIETWYDITEISTAFIRKFISLRRPDLAIEVYNLARPLVPRQLRMENAHLMTISRLPFLKSPPLLQEDKLRAEQEFTEKYEHIRTSGVINGTTVSIYLDGLVMLDSSKATQFFQDIKNGKVKIFSKDKEWVVMIPERKIYSIMIKRALKANDAAMAEILIQEMTDKGIQSSTEIYNVMIGHFIRTRQYEDALLWVNRIELDGYEKDAITYAAILYATFNKSYRDLNIEQEKFKNFRYVTDSRVLDFEAKKEQIVHLSKNILQNILQEMRAKKIPFTPHLLQTMVRGIIDISDNMYLADLLFSSGSKLIPVLEKTVVTIFEGHALKGSIERASALLLSVFVKLKINRKTYHYGLLIHRLLLEKKLESALLLFQKMIETDEALPSMAIYSSLIVAADKAKNPELDEHLARVIYHMELNNVVPKSSQLCLLMKKAFKQDNIKVGPEYAHRVLRNIK
ncbi:hypothetical protein V1514DRAFT_329494 [Lipomyces japonicus]|uniref:uncharacterized protein n=1 Tax=Lipomyces japonicus TaxID=56871 RepID=UPI0034CF2B47